MSGFLPYTYQSGLTPWSFLPTAAGTYEVGKAFYVEAGGKATPVSAGNGQDTAKGLHFIGMFTGAAMAGETEVKPFLLASAAGLILEVELTTAIPGLAVGSKYTLSADGMSITGTTTNGCFEVITILGTAAGDKVRGRLV